MPDARPGERSGGTAGPRDRALLQLVVDAALDAVIVMDAGGLVVHWASRPR